MSSKLSIIRVFDWLVGNPRGRRLRRWSFVLTLPAALASALVLGLGTGLALLAARVALWLAILLLAWRVGGERGEAVRDLLMHPKVRRYARLELRVLGAPVLALGRLLRPARRGRDDEFAYHRGGENAAIALALTPPVLAEAAAFQLLLPAGWFWAHVAAAALHAYMLVWLFALAAGPRLRPHRLQREHLVVRSGLLHAAIVPLNAVTAVEIDRRRVGERATLVVDGEAALLPSRRRVDLWLELAHDVRVTRPVGEPVFVRRLGIAADDPQRLAACLRADRPSQAAQPARRRRGGAPALAGLPELVYGA